MKKNIASWILYFIGFITYVICLSLAMNKFGVGAWLCAVGASAGVLMFAMSSYLRK